MTDPDTGMKTRQQQQAENHERVSQEAQEHGAHFYAAQELERHGRVRPQVSTELFYRYQERDYQVVFDGPRIYHHLLFSGIGGERPYHRSPPIPAPWSQ